MWLLTLGRVSDTISLILWLTFWLGTGPFHTAPPALGLDWQLQVWAPALLTSGHSIIQSHKKEGKCAVFLSAGVKCLRCLWPTSLSWIKEIQFNRWASHRFDGTHCVFLWQKNTFIWRNNRVNKWRCTGFFPYHLLQTDQAFLSLSWLLFCSTHCVKSVFVAIGLQVVLIFTTSCHMPYRVVTISSQLWPSISTTAAEALMFCALFALFGLFWMHWINFSLIELSLGFIHICTVLVCALVLAR